MREEENIRSTKITVLYAVRGLLGNRKDPRLLDEKFKPTTYVIS